MHKCGRCQAEFTSLEEFVQHKIQKRCQRGPEPPLGPEGPKVTAGSRCPFRGLRAAR